MVNRDRTHAKEDKDATTQQGDSRVSVDFWCFVIGWYRSVTVPGGETGASGFQHDITWDRRAR